METGLSMMKINEKLRLIRKVKGLSQEEVANRLKMSPNGYGSIERGDTDVNLSRLTEISNLFGVKLCDLISSDDEKHIFNIIEVNNSGDSENNQIYSTFVSSNNNNDKSAQYLKLQERNLKLQFDLEKEKILNQSKDKEIELLKEINALLKQKV